MRTPRRPALAAGLLLLLGFGGGRPADGAGSLQGQVIRVKDGDTIELLSGTARIPVRLWGIDCPEKNQPFGTVARRRAGDLCFGQIVTVRKRGEHRTRIVGEVFLPDGRSVNRELVRAGLAWWAYDYAPKDGELARLEQAARKARLGLWADPNPVPPWVWRKGGRR